MITIYQTYRNADTTEGRGPMLPDKAFLQRKDAQEYVLQQDGVMGRHPHQFGSNSWEGMGDWRVEEIQVYESLTEAQVTEKRSLRASALAKLTRSEQEALGL